MFGYDAGTYNDAHEGRLSQCLADILGGSQIAGAMAGAKPIDAFLTQPERTIPPEREVPARGVWSCPT